MNKIVLNNNQFSKLLSEFWNFENTDMFKEWKHLKNNIIIEHIKKKTIDKFGNYIDKHLFCYYWHLNKLPEIFNKEIEPEFYHEFSENELKSRFYHYCDGKKNKYSYIINYYNDNFIKNVTIVTKEKELNIKDIF